jgi:hypothetical protein
LEVLHGHVKENTKYGSFFTEIFWFSLQP